MSFQAPPSVISEAAEHLKMSKNVHVVFFKLQSFEEEKKPLENKILSCILNAMEFLTTTKKSVESNVALTFEKKIDALEKIANQSISIL